MTMERPKWSGVYPAALLPFKDDFSIDEDGYRGLLRWLAGVDGITGVMCNGHSGEIASLDREERRRVVEIAADEVGDRIRIIAAIQAEGTLEAIALTRDAKKAGAAGALIMPPHHWLRFGKDSEDVHTHFSMIGAAVDIDLLVHQYPFTTKASYSTRELLELVKIPRVQAVKYGTREMARYEMDYRLLRREAPHVAFLNCIDEYLLPGLALGGDGVLVGCATLVPELIVSLVRALERKDLPEALRIEEDLFPVVRFVYGMGEPTGAAHQRMKEALYLMGKLPSPVVRPPLRTFDDGFRAGLRRELEATVLGSHLVAAAVL